MADETPNPNETHLFTARRDRRRSPGPPMWGLGILLLIAVVAVGAWIWWGSRDSGPEPTSQVAAQPGSPTEEPFVLPPLGASDATVRDLVGTLSSHPRLASWLVTDDLARRFVEAVVSVSRGSSPLPALEVLVPADPMTVRESGGELEMDSRSYRRYDLLAEVVTSLDTEGTVRTYDRLLPLFREAYRQMGISEATWEETLARAFHNLLSVQVPEGPFEVSEAVGRYRFTDQRIESLTPAEKHLYRMGPENARRLQEKLRQIEARLDLPEVEG